MSLHAKCRFGKGDKSCTIHDMGMTNQGIFSRKQLSLFLHMDRIITVRQVLSVDKENNPNTLSLFNIQIGLSNMFHRVEVKIMFERLSGETLLIHIQLNSWYQNQIKDY